MHIIKLNATNSTNDYLKELMHLQHLENFTVVATSNQQKGRGQRNSQWISEAGKNLTISVLVKDVVIHSHELFTLNIAVTLGVLDTIKKLSSKKSAVKWPNDIMADNQKIAGILIENTIQQNGEISSIIGIGFNVNQVLFDHLHKVTSLQLLEHKDFDLDMVLNILLENLKQNISLLPKKSNVLWESYTANLFKKEIPMLFEDIHQQKFMGIIKGVSKTGMLQVYLENETIKEFAIKEIKMLY